jgi:hypothetical protein
VSMDVCCTASGYHAWSEGAMALELVKNNFSLKK